MCVCARVSACVCKYMCVSTSVSAGAPVCDGSCEYVCMCYRHTPVCGGTRVWPFPFGALRLSFETGSLLLWNSPVLWPGNPSLAVSATPALILETHSTTPVTLFVCVGCFLVCLLGSEDCAYVFVLVWQSLYQMSSQLGFN